MKILAIETATEACSAALLMSDTQVISDESVISKIKNNKTDKSKIITRFQLAPREHTKLILPMLDKVLEEANIQLSEVDAIAFGRGPGAFTGLRIAAGVAQGVALSVDKPVIPVSTLAALALQASEQADYNQNKTIVVALDARMGEIYWGSFVLKNRTIEPMGEEQVSKLEYILNDIGDESIIAIGNGWEVSNEKLPENINVIEDCLPSAQYIARLALPLLIAEKTVAVEDAQPVYIRNNVAKKSVKQKT